MEEKKLYPLRFCTLEDNYCWGREEFKLADLGYRDSLVHDGWLAGNSLGEIMDMYMDRIVGENVFEFWGRQFPVTLKLLTVSGKMPLRVHPGDDFAAERYDFLGKEKLWYVLNAGKDARVMLGFRNDCDAASLYSSCQDGSVEQLLNIVAPHAGQCFRIPPGTVHAASGDMRIVELSESSPLDFCIFSWGQELSEDEFDPALNFVDALEFVDYSAYRAATPADAGTLVDIPQFRVDRLELKTPMKVKADNFDSFTLYMCLSGAASVQIDVFGAKVDYRIGAGEPVLIPAECTEFALIPLDKDSCVLDITVPHRSEKDGYINPDVPLMPEEQ